MATSGRFRKHRRLLGHWDLWGHYHVMQGLLAWHDLSGRRGGARRRARRAADLICRTYLDGTRRDRSMPGSPEMNMAVSHVLAELHRRTGEPRYLATRARNRKGLGTRRRLRCARARKGRPFYKTPLPRWESLHDLQTLAELWRITGEARYREAFASHWRTIREFDRAQLGRVQRRRAGDGKCRSRRRRSRPAAPSRGWRCSVRHAAAHRRSARGG